MTRIKLLISSLFIVGWFFIASPYAHAEDAISAQVIQYNSQQKNKTKKHLLLEQDFGKKISKIQQRKNKYTKQIQKEQARMDKFYEKNKHNKNAKYKRSLISRLFGRSIRKNKELIEIADKNLERTQNRFRAKSAELRIKQEENIRGNKLAKMQAARKIKAEEVKSIMADISESKIAAGDNPLDIRTKDIKKQAKAIRKERQKDVKEAAKDYKNTAEWAEIKDQRKVARKLEKRGIKEGKAKKLAGLEGAINLSI